MPQNLSAAPGYRNGARRPTFQEWCAPPASSCRQVQLNLMVASPAQAVDLELIKINDKSVANYPVKVVNFILLVRHPDQNLPSLTKMVPRWPAHPFFVAPCRHRCRAAALTLTISCAERTQAHESCVPNLGYDGRGGVSSVVACSGKIRATQRPPTMGSASVVASRVQWHVQLRSRTMLNAFKMTSQPCRTSITPVQNPGLG